MSTTRTQHDYGTAQRSTAQQVVFSAAVTCCIHLCTHCVEGNLCTAAQEAAVLTIVLLGLCAFCNLSIHCTALLAAASACKMHHPNSLVAAAKLVNTLILSNIC